MAPKPTLKKVASVTATESTSNPAEDAGMSERVKGKRRADQGDKEQVVLDRKQKRDAERRERWEKMEEKKKAKEEKKATKKAEKDEERNILIELYEDLHQEQEKHKRLKADLDDAIIGQGSVVFFSDRTMKKQPDGQIVPDGPELEMYSINSRPTLESTVKKFYRDTDEGKRLEPYVQKHLVGIITTRQVIESTKLAPYGSSTFPLVEFTGEQGRYALGNGHHRHQVTRMVYKGMIDTYEKAVKTVSQIGTKAANSEKAVEERTNLVQSALYLYNHARWGVVFYDEEIIEAHANPRILYRMIASNETEFNKPDDEDDVFALAVRALYGATEKEAQELIQDILAAKPGGTRSTLATVLCNEDEMNRYSNLLIFHMFKTNRFISFWKLNTQRHFAQSFISPFVNWAIVCFRLLSSLPNKFPLVSDDIASQTPGSLTLDVTTTWTCDFEFLDQDFLDILHDSYVDHLTQFKYDFATTTDGVLWEKAYSEYSDTVLRRAEEWVIAREEGLIEGPVNDRLCLIIPRLRYLLSNGASKAMPLLRGIGNTPPLFCPRQYIDIGVELAGLEDIGIHLLTLLDPLAFGFFYIKTKGDTFVSRLFAISRAHTMYSSGEVVSPNHIHTPIADINNLNVDCQLAYIYSIRFTVLSFISSMPGRNKIWPQKSDNTKANFISQFILSAPPDDEQSDEYVFTWWVGKYLRDWILEQRAKELEAHKKIKSSTKPEYSEFMAYYSVSKNCGCFFPPCRRTQPSSEKYLNHIPFEFKPHFSAITRYLNCTSYRWGHITASGINNEIPSLVKVVCSAFRNILYYRSLIAQDPIWDAVQKLRSFISHDPENLFPSWLDIPSMPRSSAKEQRFTGKATDNSVAVAIVERTLAEVDKSATETINRMIKTLTSTLGIPCSVASQNPKAGTELRLPSSMKTSLSALINQIATEFLHQRFTHDGKFQPLLHDPTDEDIKKYLDDIGVDLPTSWASAVEKATYLSPISVEDTLAMEQGKQITKAELLLRPKQKQIKTEWSGRSATVPPKKAGKKTKISRKDTPEPQPEPEDEDDDENEAKKDDDPNDQSQQADDTEHSGNIASTGNDATLTTPPPGQPKATKRPLPEQSPSDQQASSSRLTPPGNPVSPSRPRSKRPKTGAQALDQFPPVLDFGSSSVSDAV